MASSSPIDRLLRAKGAAQTSLAKRIVASGVPWSDWSKRFNETLLTKPEVSERAAHALESAARKTHDEHGAARLRLMRGVALQRCGSPEEASRLMLEAEPKLSEVGDYDHAMQSLLLAIDALGHAGELDAALDCAARAEARIRGPRASLYRAVLRTNRANVLRLSGRLDEAAHESGLAARAFTRLGQAPSAALAKMNAGVSLMYAGHVDRARKRFEHAHQVFTQAGQTDRVMHAEYNMACLQVRSGKPGEGIVALEQLAAQAKERGRKRMEALCRMDLSDALRRVGDERSAAQQASAAFKAFDRLGAHAESVEARWLAGACLAERDVAEAAQHVEEAVVRAEALGRQEYVLRGQLLLQQLKLLRGERPDASTLARLRRRALREGLSEVAWRTQLLRVATAVERRQGGQARALLDDLPRASSRHPWIAVAADAARAQIDLLDGELNKSIRRLRALTRRIETMRGDLPGPWLRTKFLLEQLDPYLLLIDALLRRGRTADRNEAEALLDSLALRRFMAGRSPRTRSDKLTRLRKRLELLYDALADQDGSTRSLNPAQRMALIDEVRSVEQAVADAWRSVERHPRRAGHEPLPSTERTRFRGSSRANGAMRSDPRRIKSEDSGTYAHVWVQGPDVRALLRSRRGHARDLGVLASLADVRKGTRELGFHAHRVRVTNSLSAAKAFDRACKRLATALVHPLTQSANASEDQSSLHLVLDSRIGDVPWEILPTPSGMLASTKTLARVPAMRLPNRKRSRRRFSVVGSDASTCAIVSGEQSLGGARREALDLRSHGPVLVGKAATKAAALAALQCYDVVHLAMHGVSLPDAPSLGGLRLTDGWLTAVDVPAQIAARVVCLAACQTGAPAGPAGDAWGALPQALLRSGAEWVLWTSSDVDDETTADLMSAFHPLSGVVDIPQAFGRALEQVAADQGTAARLVPFRLTGHSAGSHEMMTGKR